MEKWRKLLHFRAEKEVELNVWQCYIHVCTKVHWYAIQHSSLVAWHILSILMFNPFLCIYNNLIFSMTFKYCLC
jgi:hypothetical protein